MRPVVRRRLARVTMVVGAVAGIGLVAGLDYQWLRSRADLAAFPAPGAMLDVGGYELHVDCRGQGSPTVVFEAGAGSASADYATLHDRLAAVTRTCLYDRAGLGWSDWAGPLDIDRMAQRLERLLAEAGVPAPYLLAGHSFGGYVIRVFAARYPDRVAGMAFVESATEHQWRELPAEVGAAVTEAARQLTWAPLLARFGVVRLLQPRPTTPTEASRLRPNFLRAFRHELQIAAAAADRSRPCPGWTTYRSRW